MGSTGKEVPGKEMIEGCGSGSMLEEGPGASMLNRILGGEVRDKTEVRGIEEKGRTGMTM